MLATNNPPPALLWSMITNQHHFPCQQESGQLLSSEQEQFRSMST